MVFSSAAVDSLPALVEHRRQTHGLMRAHRMMAAVEGEVIRRNSNARSLFRTGSSGLFATRSGSSGEASHVDEDAGDVDEDEDDDDNDDDASWSDYTHSSSSSGDGDTQSSSSSDNGDTHSSSDDNDTLSSDDLSWMDESDDEYEDDDEDDHDADNWSTIFDSLRRPLARRNIQRRNRAVTKDKPMSCRTASPPLQHIDPMDGHGDYHEYESTMVEDSSVDVEQDMTCRLKKGEKRDIMAMINPALASTTCTSMTTTTMTDRASSVNQNHLALLSTTAHSIERAFQTVPALHASIHDADNVLHSRRLDRREAEKRAVRILYALDGLRLVLDHPVDCAMMRVMGRSSLTTSAITFSASLLQFTTGRGLLVLLRSGAIALAVAGMQRMLVDPVSWAMEAVERAKYARVIVHAQRRRKKYLEERRLKSSNPNEKPSPETIKQWTVLPWWERAARNLILATLAVLPLAATLPFQRMLCATFATDARTLRWDMLAFPRVSSIIQYFCVDLAVDFVRRKALRWAPAYYGHGNVREARDEDDESNANIDDDSDDDVRSMKSNSGIPRYAYHQYFGTSLRNTLVNVIVDLLALPLVIHAQASLISDALPVNTAPLSLISTSLGYTVLRACTNLLSIQMSSFARRYVLDGMFEEGEMGMGLLSSSDSCCGCDCAHEDE